MSGVISHQHNILDRDFTDSGKLKFLPQVLQKNIGLFSFLSQLAQEGYSSQEDSTRKRRSESVGGLEWPSRREVTFLQVAVVILN